MSRSHPCHGSWGALVFVSIVMRPHDRVPAASVAYGMHRRHRVVVICSVNMRSAGFARAELP
jgi:hypothetical protein